MLWGFLLFSQKCWKYIVLLHMKLVLLPLDAFMISP